MSVSPHIDKNGYFTVVCRLCGQEWLYPKRYENQFDEKHHLENCSFCKRRLMRLEEDEE